jgi:hypothetical protein
MYLKYLDCEGTREEINDYCLLHLRAQQTNELHSAEIKKVLTKTTETIQTGSWNELIAKRLQGGSFKDETDWIVHCLRSDSPDLALQAIGAAQTLTDPRITEAACSIMADTKADPDVRAGAIHVAGKSKDRVTLLALCALLDDRTPTGQFEHLATTRKEHPLEENPGCQMARSMSERMKHSPEGKKTIGEIAREQLKNLAKKDFHEDSSRWKEWASAQPK